MNALQLFHSGLDYIAIGVILNIHESEVEKRIHALRRKEAISDYQRAYREANKESAAEYRKRHNAALREELREIRARHAS